MLSKSGEGIDPCFLPNLRGKAFSLSSLNMILEVVFFVGALYQVQVIIRSILNLLRGLGFFLQFFSFLKNWNIFDINLCKF